jgi:isopenicillin N synthase-like dioxygenase
MAKEMPVLDAACMANGDSKQRAEFGAKFLEAMTEHGFVKLVRQLKVQTTCQC